MSNETIKKLFNFDKNTSDGSVDNWSSTSKFSVVFLSKVDFNTVFT